MDDLSKALMSFALGAVGTYLATVSKVRKDLEAKYDESLRASRIGEYKKLWGHLEVLAKYSPPGPVTAAKLATLSEALRRWYFSEGGIFLSDAARDAYFDLQKGLVGTLGHSRDQQRTDDVLKPEALEPIVRLGSALRTAMAADVGTRKRPILGTESDA